MTNVDFDDVDNDFDDDDDEVEDSQEPNLVKQLRGTTRAQKKLIRDLQKQVNENNSAARRLAILDADLPKTKQMDFFLSKYEGAWDKDSLRSAAAEAGFLETEEKEVNDEVDMVESMMNASQGGWPSDPPGSNSEVKEKIARVKAGPNASREIERILADHGLLVSDE